MSAKDNKKIIPLLIVTSICAFLYIGPNETRNDLAIKELEKQHEKEIDVIIPKKKTISRSIASIPTPKAPTPKREVVGKYTDLGNIRLINKENKDWKKLYSNNFLRMLGDHKVSDFKVKLKKSILKVTNNIGHQLEHVVVSYNRPDGNPYSFEALIDSETGHAVQTWNQTRYEFKQPAKLKAIGREYKED